MMKKIVKCAVMVTPLLMTPAFAVEPISWERWTTPGPHSVYVGFDMGNNFINIGGAGGKYMIREEDDQLIEAFDLVVGYAFNPWVRLEWQSPDLGRHDVHYREANNRWRRERSQDLTTLSLVVDYPVTAHANVYVRAGAGKLEVDDVATPYELTSTDASFPGHIYDYAGAVTHHSGSKTLALGGLGVRVKTARKVEVIGEYRVYQSALGADMSTISLGLNWHFWKF